MKTKMFKKGFTLIELLIVIAIIGILAVALLPSILNAPASARDAAKKSKIENTIVAIEQYNSTNGSIPTASACLKAGATGGTADLLAPYFKSGLPAIDHGVSITVGAMAACDGIVYCPLAGGRYFVAAGMEKTGTGTGYYDIVATNPCDGTGAVTTITNPPTAATAKWGVIQ